MTVRLNLTSPCVYVSIPSIYISINPSVHPANHPHASAQNVSSPHDEQNWTVSNKSVGKKRKADVITINGEKKESIERKS
jgi:hypothetical protein